MDIAIANLIFYIDHWVKLFAGVQVIHIEMSHNHIAETLAKIGQFQFNQCHIYNSPPLCIHRFLFGDFAPTF